MSEQPWAPAQYGEDFRSALLEPQLAAARRRKRRIAVTVAGAGAAVCLIGAGATAYAALSGGGPQPETQVPADAFAFAKVDFDPSAAAKLSALTFLGHFPDVDTSSDLRAAVLQPLLRETEVDYQQDLEPWLGDRAGVAALPAATDGEAPEVLAVVQSKDDAGAARLLDRLQERSPEDPDGHFGFVVRDGWVLLAESQAEVDAAARASASSPLSEDEEFRSDLEHVAGDLVAAAWADPSYLLDFARRAAAEQPDDPAAAGVLAALDGLDASNPLLSGRFVLGVRIGDNHVELESRSIRTRPEGFDAARGVSDVVAGLPFDTSVAVGVSGGGDVARAYWDMLRSDPATAAALDESAPQVAQLGVRLPEDLVTLFSEQAVVSVGPIAGSATSFAVRTVGEPGAVQELFGRVAEGVGPTLPGGSLSSVPAQDGGVLASSQEYGDALAVAGGGLGGTGLYRLAVPEADGAMGVVYVHLAEILGAVGTTTAEPAPAWLTPFAALGMSTGYEGDDAVARWRVVVR